MKLAELCAKERDLCLGSTKPFVMVISGFPACGKTGLAICVQQSLPDKSVYIGAGNWLVDLETRRKLGISGVSLRAYDVERALKDLQELIAYRPIHVYPYNHVTRHHSEIPVTVSMFNKDLLILDGTIFLERRFADFCDHAVALIPASKHEWLLNSITRDCKERAYSEDIAREQSIAKFEDACLLLKSNSYPADEAYLCSGKIKWLSGELSFRRIAANRIRNPKDLIGP